MATRGFDWIGLVYNQILLFLTDTFLRLLTALLLCYWLPFLFSAPFLFCLFFYPTFKGGSSSRSEGNKARLPLPPCSFFSRPGPGPGQRGSGAGAGPDRLLFLRLEKTNQTERRENESERRENESESSVREKERKC